MGRGTWPTVYARNISGAWFFGLGLADTVRRIETLPGTWRCAQYRFVYEDRHALHDHELHNVALQPVAMLTISATGCARAEVYVRRGVHRRLRRLGQSLMKVRHLAPRFGAQ